MIAKLRSYSTPQLAAVVTVILIALLVCAVWFVSKNHTQDLDNPNDVKLLVGKHYILPNNEEPALVTVTDKSKVESDFLKLAEDGDKLLLYKNAKKAFLYRPSVDRLVEVGPISIAGSG